MNDAPYIAEDMISEKLINFKKLIIKLCPYFTDDSNHTLLKIENTKADLQYRNKWQPENLRKEVIGERLGRRIFFQVIFTKMVCRSMIMVKLN